MLAAPAADVVHMERCLALAEAHRGRTAPNPIVGCVILDRRGRVIAEGAHRGPGTRHAEADALHALGARISRARGGTLYCNLEPCMHQGRTPPCVPAILAAGLARVVVGSADPIPGHGGGIVALRRAGVRVDRALVAACDRANRPFLTWARAGRSAFTLKAGVTLDGKIATRAGQSQWITSPAARADALRLRDTHDAILVGVGTVLADDPALTARGRGPRGLRDPVRVVLDSRLRTPATARVLPAAPGAGARVIIATTAAAPTRRERALVARGAEVWRLPDARGRVRVDALARRLAEAGLLAVLVEGGGEVHAAMLAAGYADQVILYVAPLAVGGHAAPSWIGGPGVAALADGAAFTYEDVGRVGPDLRITLAARPAPVAGTPRRRTARGVVHGA